MKPHFPNGMNVTFNLKTATLDQKNQKRKKKKKKKTNLFIISVNEVPLRQSVLMHYENSATSFDLQKNNFGRKSARVF